MSKSTIEKAVAQLPAKSELSEIEKRLPHVVASLEYMWTDESIHAQFNSGVIFGMAYAVESGAVADELYFLADIVTMPVRFI